MRTRWPRIDKRAMSTCIVVPLFPKNSYSHPCELITTSPYIRSNPKHGWFTRKFAKQHLNPPVHMIFPSRLCLKGKARKIHTNQGAQMPFAHFRVNQPCFRWHCKERYWTEPQTQGLSPKITDTQVTKKTSHPTLRISNCSDASFCDYVCDFYHVQPFLKRSGVAILAGESRFVRSSKSLQVTQQMRFDIWALKFEIVLLTVEKHMCRCQTHAYVPKNTRTHALMFQKQHMHRK